mgnify:CR=1 FL=1
MNIEKLYNIIIELETLLDFKFLNLSFFSIKKNNKWWKWLLSGLNGDFLKLNFRIIENKISKGGYHKRSAIKYGDIIGKFKLTEIRKYPVNIPTR